MKGQEDIFYNEGRLCIKIAEGDNVLKGLDTPQNKQDALLFHQGAFTELPWQGFMVLEGKACIVFFPNENLSEIPIPCTELAHSLRPRCISLLRDLSVALEMAGNRLNWILDSIPLSNIWFLQNGDILLLPAQMGDAIDLFELDAERFLDREVWYAHNCVEGFGKANYLFQLLYYSLSGIRPFEDLSVREDHFRAIPLELHFPADVTEIRELCIAVDKSLSDNRKYQLQKRRPLDFFRAVLDDYKDFDVDSLKTGENPGLEDFYKGTQRRAKIRAFVRKKGFKVFLIVLAAATALGIAGFYIYRAVKPPLTRDLNEAQIIEYYYDAMTRMDTEDLAEPLKFGYSGPDMTQVSTLYVTSTMQRVYEGGSLIIDPNQWLADGKPALVPGNTVFGVTDVKVEKLSDDVFRAIVTTWSSQNYMQENNDFDIEAGMDVYRHIEVVEFTFRSRGNWREVSKIEHISDEVVETIHVNYQTN